ncbi:hypothetical protein DMB37_31945 [Nocardia sp. CS682]|nr:hypothetical protein DMB37_31945 [Nocardia sp. CS682]
MRCGPARSCSRCELPRVLDSPHDERAHRRLHGLRPLSGQHLRLWPLRPSTVYQPT